MARIAVVLVVVICAPILIAQQPVPADNSSSFEVASIRPSAAGGRYGLGFLPDASLSATSAVVERLILMAYSLHSAQLANKPKWIEEDRFDIQARSPAGASAGRPEMLRRLQTLLRDRFALQTHTETRKADVYALTFPRNDRALGQQIVPCAKDDDKSAAPSVKPCGASFSGPLARPGTVEGTYVVIRVTAVPMSQIALSLSQFAGRMVVDETGLSGLFDMLLRVPEDEQLSSSASVFTAVQEQLGLQLEARRADIPVLVIDRIERPMPN